jgi:hypothetical protein
MITIDGKKYLGEKELSTKYGLPVSWFRRARYDKCSPPYCKLHNKIYYEEISVDEWFKKNLIECA